MSAVKLLSRQVMVNIVLATDIWDKDLGALRKERWNKTFAAMLVPMTYPLMMIPTERQPLRWNTWFRPLM
jgi:hypothetical protein